MAKNKSHIRSYTQSHPWLTFNLDLKKAPFELWLLLGECRSKCDHLSGVPLRPQVAEDFYRVYLAKGAHGSAAIEGNSLSEQQVRDRVDRADEDVVPESQEYLQQEVDNIIKACRDIAHRIYVENDVDLTIDRIKEYNRIVLKGADLEDGMKAGVIPDQVIGVGSYGGVPCEDCDYLLERLCDWITKNRSHSILEKGMPILMAIVAHVYFEWIHPFPDGNGRTGRLIEFHILNASGIPAPASHLLSNHYNLTRDQYYKELQNASRSGGDLYPFLLYALKGFRDGLREQIVRIRQEQLDVAWINYVHQKFTGKDTTAPSRRRRRVALALRDRNDGVVLHDIAFLTPHIAQAYTGKSIRTVKRDLNSLLEMELVAKSGSKYYANTSTIEAWLPRVVAIATDDK